MILISDKKGVAVAGIWWPCQYRLMKVDNDYKGRGKAVERHMNDEIVTRINVKVLSQDG